MPELPDVSVYVERLGALLGGQRLEAVRLKSPFLLRSFEPPLNSVVGRRVQSFSRIGKRIVFAFEGELYLVFHLMIAGRFHMKPRAAKLPGKIGLLAMDFEQRTLILTEAGTKRRASLHVVNGAQGLAAHDRGGIDPLTASPSDFAGALATENRTIKRALMDPRWFSGIGNAYSDEILHRAKLSPAQRTHNLKEEEVTRIQRACREVLTEWVERLRREAGDGFPEKVTAFRPEMAVHGRFKEPCPVCSTAIQRIVYAENEANYCPRCQTGGRLLADRAMSRLLGADFPRRIEELEELEPLRSGKGP